MSRRRKRSKNSQARIIVHGGTRKNNTSEYRTVQRGRRMAGPVIVSDLATLQGEDLDSYERLTGTAKRFTIPMGELTPGSEKNRLN